MNRTIGLGIGLMLLAVTFSFISARDTHRSKTQTADAIRVAEDWKDVAERWEKIAHQFEAEARRCR